MHLLLLAGMLGVLLRSRNLPHCVLHFTEKHLPAYAYDAHTLGVAWGIKVFCDGFCLASTAPALPDADQIFWAVLLGFIISAAYGFRKTLGNVYQYCKGMLLDSRLSHRCYHRMKSLLAPVAKHDR